MASPFFSSTRHGVVDIHKRRRDVLKRARRFENEREFVLKRVLSPFLLPPNTTTHTHTHTHTHTIGAHIHIRRTRQKQNRRRPRRLFDFVGIASKHRMLLSFAVARFRTSSRRRRGIMRTRNVRASFQHDALNRLLETTTP